MSEVQVKRGSLDQTIPIPAKMNVRNGRGVDIPALSSNFIISVTGTGEGAECGPATLTKRDGSKSGRIAVPDVVAGTDL